MKFKIFKCNVDGDEGDLAFWCDDLEMAGLINKEAINWKQNVIYRDKIQFVDKSIKFSPNEHLKLFLDALEKGKITILKPIQFKVE